MYGPRGKQFVLDPDAFATHGAPVKYDAQTELHHMRGTEDYAVLATDAFVFLMLEKYTTTGELWGFNHTALLPPLDADPDKAPPRPYGRYARHFRCLLGCLDKGATVAVCVLRDVVDTTGRSLARDPFLATYHYEDVVTRVHIAGSSTSLTFVYDCVVLSLDTANSAPDIDAIVPAMKERARTHINKTLGMNHHVRIMDTVSSWVLSGKEPEGYATRVTRGVAQLAYMFGALTMDEPVTTDAMAVVNAAMVLSVADLVCMHASVDMRIRDRYHNHKRLVNDAFGRMASLILGIDGRVLSPVAPMIYAPATLAIAELRSPDVKAPSNAAQWVALAPARNHLIHRDAGHLQWTRYLPRAARYVPHTGYPQLYRAGKYGTIPSTDYFYATMSHRMHVYQLFQHQLSAAFASDATLRAAMQRTAAGIFPEPYDALTENVARGARVEWETRHAPGESIEFTRRALLSAFWLICVFGHVRLLGAMTPLAMLWLFDSRVVKDTSGILRTNTNQYRGDVVPMYQAYFSTNLTDPSDLRINDNVKKHLESSIPKDSLEWIRAALPT